MDDRHHDDSQLRLAADRAALPFALLEQMQIPCGYERSFKMLPGKLLANRYLLGVDLKNVNSEQLRSICQRLNMPEEYLASFWKHLPEANLVFLGFEDNLPTGIYKVYLEFWERVKLEVQAQPGSREPKLLHLGFKWNVADNTQRTITKYLCHPRLSIEQILRRMTDVYEGWSSCRSLVIACEIVAFAADRADPSSFIYLEVAEGESQRRSFDINVYAAMLTLSSIHPALIRLRDHFAIPTDTFDRLNRLTCNKLLGHLSGGISQHGEEFLTIYYEA